MALHNQHFDGGGGNLYKEVWPVNSEGESRSNEYFKDGLKTMKRSQMSQKLNPSLIY